MLRRLLRNRSLYFSLGVIIIFTVVVILSLHAAYNYTSTKQQIVEEMKQSSRQSLVMLQKNISSLIESYAIHEYDMLVQTELDRRNAFAIVVEDYNMGEIMGETAYISGKIRDRDNTIIDYDPENELHRFQIKASFYSDSTKIINQSGQELGSIRIYITDKAMNRELKKIITETLFNTVIISLLLILLLFIGIRLFVLEPLSRIVDSIENSDEDGIPIEPISSHGPKEISTLSFTMNNMIDSITGSREVLQNQKDELRFQAYHDALTGLANRYLFDDRIEHGIAQSKRKEKKMALLFIDLDNFKEVNDSLGYKAGEG